jgi:hypothetical protein
MVQNAEAVQHESVLKWLMPVLLLLLLLLVCVCVCLIVPVVSDCAHATPTQPQLHLKVSTKVAISTSG